MKFVLVMMAFALGLNAQATLPGYNKVPDDKIDQYKKAFRAAIQQNPDVITACDPQWVRNMFNFSSEVLVSTNNSQPLVLFNTYYPTAVESLHRLAFFTSADLKTLTKVHAEIYALEEVNTGDLANPVFVEDYVIKGRWDCARQVQ